MHSVSLFGFGSFFNSGNINSDIDLLIVHDSLEEGSCRSGLRCKALIREKVPKAHITVLSAPEEQSLGFIDAAKARHLSDIDASDLDDQIHDILSDWFAEKIGKAATNPKAIVE